MEYSDGTIFYLPILESRIGPPTERDWFETDDEGRLTRSYSNHGDGIFFGDPTPMTVIQHFGLAEMWPAGFSSFGYFRVDQDNLSRDSNSDGFHLSNSGFISADDLNKDKYLSLDENFWIIDFSKDVSTDSDGTRANRYFRVLSKKPMLQGLYVYGDCDNNCEFHTIENAKNWRKAQIHYRIIDLNLRRNFGDQSGLTPSPPTPDYFASDCPLENPVVNCDHADIIFRLYPKAFLTVDRMVEMLKTKPAPIKETAK